MENEEFSPLDYLFADLDTPIISGDEDYRKLAELFPEEE